MMPITVELFGIARQRAGVAQTTARGARLGDVLADLADRFPALAESCLDGGQLQPPLIANLDGRRFVRDPETRLTAGARLLIMSADGGG
jgi:molybdopterin converting factor small subunit